MQPDEHSTYIEWLHSELDGELSPRERSRLQQHLASCAECRDEKRQLLALQEVISSSRIRVRRGFKGQVMAALPVAGWEARHRRGWTAALILVALLGGGAAALVGTSAARLEPTVPFLGAVAAVFELIQSSVLAGAGLLGASWRGLGLAFERLLSTSIWNVLAFGILVVAVDYLLIRLVLRRKKPAEATASRSSARAASHRDS